MGTMSILLAAAAAKRQRERAHASAVQKRRAQQRKQEHYRSTSSFSYDSGNSYLDCLYLELHNENPELLEFFKKLTGFTYECLDDDCAMYINECNEIAAQAQEVSEGKEGIK